MSANNPYATHLGDRNPREVIAATPGRLAALFDTLGAAGLNRSFAPGKWTASKILCHLADCETVFAFRLRQALAEDHHLIQTFDQDLWATNYDAYDARGALDVFSALRRWNVRLIDSLPAAAFSKTLAHPERGEMTFGAIVETMAGHDLNHTRQLESIAGQ
jgi:hypothetical protein